MSKPRQPGSQVAPGLKPLHTNRTTASKHSKVPLEQATAGRLYRVRDKDWAALWGENLTWKEATELKDLVVGRKKSRTARVEDMAIPPPPGITVPPVTTLELGGTVKPTNPHRDVTVRAERPRKVAPPGDATVPGARQLGRPAPVANRVQAFRHDIVPLQLELSMSPLARISYLTTPSRDLSELPKFVTAPDGGEYRIQTDGIIDAVPDGYQLLARTDGVSGGGWVALRAPAFVICGDVVMVRPLEISPALPNIDVGELMRDLGEVSEDDLEHAASDDYDSPVS